MPSTLDEYVAVAVDHRGKVVGTYRSASVRGLMATADERSPNALSVTIRSNFTSDGTYWGEGGGRIMASRDYRGWQVESTAPIKQPPAGKVPWKSRFHALDAWLRAWQSAYAHRPNSDAYKSSGMKVADELWKKLSPREQNAVMKFLSGEWTERELRERIS